MTEADFHYSEGFNLVLLKAGVKVDKVWEERLSGVLGNQKGAAAVRLNFGDKSLLFITSHLARKSSIPHCAEHDRRSSPSLLTADEDICRILSQGRARTRDSILDWF